VGEVEVIPQRFWLNWAASSDDGVAATGVLFEVDLDDLPVAEVGFSAGAVAVMGGSILLYCMSTVCGVVRSLGVETFCDHTHVDTTRVLLSAPPLVIVTGDAVTMGGSCPAMRWPSRIYGGDKLGKAPHVVPW
jgi:hypothetical protein